MNENKVKSKIGKLIELNWQELKSLQPDNVKVPYNYGYLKDSILKYGFSRPFAVWENDGEYYTVDGHTRKDILIELIADGIPVPDKLKAYTILADDKKEAIKILLEVYNQKHNPLNDEVLTEWLNVENISIEEINISSINSQEHIDWDGNLDDFFEDEPEQEENKKHKIILEYTEDDYAKVIEELNKRNGTKEEIIYKLLNI